MNETTKESKFLDAINKYAEKQKSMINSEVEEYKAQKIEQATDAGLKDAYDLIRRDIAARKSAIVTEYAQKKYKLRRGLYAERSRIADEVFKKAFEKLAEYTTTEEYRASVIKAAHEAAALCADAPCTVCLRKKDQVLFDRIAPLFVNASCSADDTIRIGGVKVMCRDKGLLIDSTLDSKLAAERRSFEERSGLKVV